MDKNIYESYPHKCDYLEYLWEVELLSGRLILERTIDMQGWLDTVCFKNFIWSNNYSKFPLDYSKNTVFMRNSSLQIALADAVYFREEQDLLAFKLRWGIRDIDNEYDPCQGTI